MPNEQSRFGQGASVDRNRPHLFHRDYWALRAVRRATEQFFQREGSNLRGKRVLDYGAGDSPYSQYAESVGAELIRADIEAEGNTDVIRIHLDGRIDLPDNSIDAIISTQVLEHVPDVQLYLREGLRVLKPGGAFFLSTHGAWVLHRIPTDFHRWTIDGLPYEFRRAGMDVETVTSAVGVLACSTHLRSILIGGLLRRVPGLALLCPLVYLFFNLRMGLEELITPASVMEVHPELVIVTARKPMNGKDQSPEIGGQSQ